MRKKLVVILVPLALLVALAAWAALSLGREAPEWTTASPEALSYLQRGIDAERKYYHAEAYGHFAKGVELDPRCAGCRLGMLRNSRVDMETADAMVAELSKLDRERLNERERFLVDYTVARFAGERKRANELVAAFVARHPDDPYALEAQSEVLWREQKLDEVEKVYERMLAIDPNYVTAQNRLGYLAMSQGDFAAAEDRFRTYRYVAPDQANPHDSLGELFVLTGRWDEARAELEEAVRIRPDFCAAYENMIHIPILTGKPQEGLPIVERASRDGRCDEETLDRQRCRIDLWTKLQERRYAELTEDFEGSCAADLKVSPWIPHLAALLQGDVDTARDIEAWAVAAKRKSEDDAYRDPTAPHLEAMRLVAEGDLAEAARQFAAADAMLDYWTGNGVFKLYNRLQWVNALERAGEAPAAAKLLAEVAAVNPSLAAEYRAGEIARPEPLPDARPRRRRSERTTR
jgi:Flp pilus assembly protein TadD